MIASYVGENKLFEVGPSLNLSCQSCSDSDVFVAKEQYLTGQLEVKMSTPQIQCRTTPCDPRAT